MNLLAKLGIFLRIHASACEQSNKRSGVRLKTESETGGKRVTHSSV